MKNEKELFAAIPLLSARYDRNHKAPRNFAQGATWEKLEHRRSQCEIPYVGADGL